MAGWPAACAGVAQTRNEGPDCPMTGKQAAAKAPLLASVWQPTVWTNKEDRGGGEGFCVFVES